MFESLKKKLFSFLGKEEKPQKKSRKKEKKKKETKIKKPKLSKKEKIEEKRGIIAKISESIGISSKAKKQKEKPSKKKEIEPKISLTFEPSKQKYELDVEKKEESVESIIEEIKQEEKTKEPQKENFFSKLMKKFSSSQRLTKEQFDEVFQELEIILLENNVALEVVEKIKKDLETSLIGMEIKRDKLYYQIIESLKISILEVLIEPPNLIQAIKESKEPYVILFFGINGSGKTTTIAKLAHLLKKNNISSVIAAADTFRAASIEQLKIHCSNLNIPIISNNYGADPASVAFDAISYAKKNHIKVVLIDTAGRMYTKLNLMKEMEKIVRVSNPNLKIFVGESITGNDATEQAKMFNETAGIDGIILTKADVDEKAGTILSVSYVTKKPIYFLGTGQSYDDLMPFKKKEILKNLGLE
ncbi:MAG: signal recognition particle-docking protein FtsY [Candidatus Pacearchaeota archaeon]|nr:signal recognition particle-docking protein FtsY [Candidatus Pacearchaeota archaeon]